MFTGIVEEIGQITALEDHGTDIRLRIHGPKVMSDAKPGDSISVNGVCLTVAGSDQTLEPTEFNADVMPESLRLTNLGDLTVGSAVNLERAALVGGRLDGHIVQGHVDGVGTLLSRNPGPRWDDLVFEIPAELSRYIVQKGSITVSGVSLTVTEVTDTTFGLSLIPTTLEVTTLGAAQVGDRVNLEVDVIAKYIERLLEARS